MKKKVLFTSLSLMAASVCVCGSFSAPLITETYARSAPLEEEEDSKDAIKGKVTICAIFDENHKYPVTVDLCPTFDGGVHHYYTLTPENPTASDKIAVGSYRTVSYLAEEDKDYGDAGTKVFAQRADVTVTESTESVAPSTVVIVADKGFIDKYAYELTSYRDDDGNALSEFILKVMPGLYMTKTSQNKLVTIQPMQKMTKQTRQSKRKFQKEKKQTQVKKASRVI